MMINFVLLGMSSFIFSFLACEVGERLRVKFTEIDYEIAQMDWYRFPTVTWNMLSTIMNTAQVPIVIKGIGGIVCNREQFKEVSRFNKYDQLTLMFWQKKNSGRQHWIFMFYGIASNKKIKRHK